jgi:hypothetical protein
MWSNSGMKTIHPVMRGILSFVVPGLGQMVSGRGERGAWILGLVLVVGNLNAIFLSVYAPTLHMDLPFFARGLPHLLHDIFSLYGIIFWVWQALDAAQGLGKEWQCRQTTT